VRRAAMSRASKQLGTNVNKKLLVEIQALIAFACYDSPAIATGGDSMTEGAQTELIKEMYFGGGDPENISFVDQFVHGLNRFTGLFTSSEPDESGKIVLTMPHKLHRHAGLNIFVGPTSITKELLLKKSFASNDSIHPRTLFRKAKEVIATCKKMMGLVTASGSPYRDGTFPSGTNWDDYILWCLVAMQEDCAREESLKATSKAAAKAATTKEGDNNDKPSSVVQMQGTGTTTPAGAGVEEEKEEVAEPRATESTTTVPSGSFFKAGIGFLAWALWGHIPLCPGEGMISLHFSEAKAGTSFGRGTSTRSAMRKALMAASAAPVDNRRGKKREATSVPAVSTDGKEDLALLTKTLELLSSESMEKEEKQQHQLQVRLVRDKLAARRRRSEVLLQKIGLASKSKKKTDDTTLLEQKVESIESDIEALENELENLQQLECDRHSKMLEKRRKMTCVETMMEIGMLPISISESFESNGTESGSGNDDSDANKNETEVVNVSGADAAASKICMECKLIPTDHVCLKCKAVRVCSCCCDEKRDLQNITWCQACFEKETAENQVAIRNGNYKY
jgi:hypothetical protein